MKILKKRKYNLCKTNVEKFFFILNNEWKFRRLHKEDTLEYVISLLQGRAIDGQFHFMDNWFPISR